MIKKLHLAVLPVLFLFQTIAAQSFLSVEFLEHKTPDELTQSALFQTTFPYGSNAYKVTYKTADLNGDTVVVSGLLALPDDLTNIYPLACYQHGTAGSKDNVPSRLALDASIATSLAGKGYVTVAPDLLGLGDHAGVHPFVHAASEAWVAVDMMRAVRVYAESNDIYLNDQVFVTGYSQGGHSAMALHRQLEHELSDEFPVTAAAPMSGPYSIAEVMHNLIISGEVYTRPAYLINTFISYQEVYGNIYPDIETAFNAPYQQVVEDFANNTITLTELDEQLTMLLGSNEGAVIPLKVLKDDYINAVQSNPDHPMNIAMQENNVYDWTPEAPTRLFYCEADEEVPFENSTLAESTMIANGATDVKAVNVNSQVNHFICALLAGVAAVNFFEDYQVIEDAPVATKEVRYGELQLFPNPASSEVFLKNLPLNGEVELFNMNGQLNMKQSVSKGDNLLRIGNLPDGLYLVKFISQQHIKSQKLMIK